jgi:hypothetical protein
LNEGMIKISGLWKSKMKDGGVMLKGGLNPIISLVIMPNDYKRSDKDPDYFAYWSKNEKNESESKQENLDL